MSSISGKKKELSSSSFTKKVGLFEAKVLAINPTAEEFKDLLNIETSEDLEYVSKTNSGEYDLVRFDVWLEEIKSKQKFKCVFFIKDKVRTSKDELKTQYINSIGKCFWGTSVSELPEWFTERDVREAFDGEEEFYKFLTVWLGELDLRDEDAKLMLSWKALISGKFNEITDQLKGDFCTNVGAMACIKTVIKEDEVKEYQEIYNKGFIPAYLLKHFNVVNYNDGFIINSIKNKKGKKTPVEKYISEIHGEYGCKYYFELSKIHDYNPDDNLVASDKVIAPDSPNY